MLVMVDFGVERVLVSAYDMTQALRTAWSDMIYQYDENKNSAVERFREEIAPTEGNLRAHTQSCRDFGYKWTSLEIKETKELTEQEYETLSSVAKLRIASW